MKIKEVLPLKYTIEKRYKKKKVSKLLRKKQSTNKIWEYLVSPFDQSTINVVFKKKMNHEVKDDNSNCGE